MVHQVVVEEFRSIVAIEALEREGQSGLDGLDLGDDTCAPLFQAARHSVQPERMSVIVRLQTKSPARELPQCATVSASTEPG